MKESLHGESRRKKKTPEYIAWAGMKTRCRNSKDQGYHNYGGRGITVCAEWQTSYEVFLASVGRRPSAAHSLDRINNEGNYEPGNVRWITKKEQARNQRRNSLLTFNNEAHCVSEWAEILGIARECITGRLRLGWSIERTLTTPPKARRKKQRTEPPM